jgi:phosphatidylserine/phosphatidylglycerophosphate/cardiolipin synthase-like enzyme
MPNCHLFFDSPELYSEPYKFYMQGASPQILKQFINFIKENQQNIDTIYMCMYLYNNPILNDFFDKLAKCGIKVNVVSIPLEGYDNTSPQDLYDVESPDIVELKGQTKLSMAEAIYNRIKSSRNSNFNLFIFPHMYIRSPRVRPFSRGDMPYSLHAKSIFIKYKNGGGAVGLTSSNLATRDMVKDEMMLLVEGDEIANEEADRFFLDLISNSFSISTFDEKRNWLKYNIPVKKYSLNTRNTYSAPFYNNSQDIIEEYLIQLVLSAKQRVIVCAQHICAFNYSYNLKFKTANGESGYARKPGLLSAVLKKAREGIEVNCLSQTFVDGNGDSHGCRRPENTRAFSDFIREFETYNNCSYAVNPSVHSKYLIVDDIAVVTTCNFTPTQFIYLQNVDISSFDNIPGVSYSGIHSEVGQFLTIHDKGICETLLKNFNEIWSRINTYHHNNKSINKKVKKCPLCNSVLNKRNGRYGEFWGCSAYPQCRYTEKIN